MSRRKGQIVSDLKLPPKLRVASVDGQQVESAPTAAREFRADRPVKPEDLPDSLCQIWDDIVEALDDAGLLSKVDGPAISLALRHYMVAVRASEEVVTDGPMLWDEKNGRHMKHPASTVFAQQSSAFLEYAKQLGLTFVSRARTPARQGDDDGQSENPFAISG